MEPFLDFVDAAVANVYQCTRNRHEAFLEQENDETEIEIRAVDIIVLLEDMSQIQSTRPVLIQDEELNSK